MKKYRYVLALFLFITTIYFWWSNFDRNPTLKETSLKLREISEFGQADNSKGNIVSIQPFMFTADYANLENFYNKIDSYFAKAQVEGFFNENTVVILPEHLGTGLIAENEKKSVLKASNISKACELAIWSNLINFIPEYLNAPDIPNKKQYALFSMKSDKMAHVFNFVFSSMANKYNVYVIPGSIIIRNPNVKDGKLNSNKGDLFNISLLYKPDGTAYPHIIRKACPFKKEQDFIKSGSFENIPVFDLPIGKTKILISNDAWYPEAYSKNNKDASVILSPGFLPEKLDEDWKSIVKELEPLPKDINPDKNITTESAQLEHGLPGRLYSNHIPTGVSSFLRGDLWNVPNEGYTIVYNEKEILTGYKIEGASIINLWLN
ncbi:hypothetical protein [Chondrinema litorale]|uniref:hypothetical protein n=1 Tax=Chondrinema litorale TaxID=2994555 RepID=UPI0025439089|nr:hypothetical protein [Chondrinema litorale]UZR95616.1 hypothetical protein OQ292_07305 [Chondrinema litorale]